MVNWLNGERETEYRISNDELRRQKTGGTEAEGAKAQRMDSRSFGYFD
jgi:hypothetical protein